MEPLLSFQIFREKGNIAEILPQFLSKYTTSELRKSGINVMPEKELRRVTVDESGKLRLQLTTGGIIILIFRNILCKKCSKRVTFEKHLSKA